MWLAERDACSEARATIRMSRYSLYTAVRRRGGAPGRPLHRSAPPASARSRSRAESYVCPARLRGRRPAARRSKSRYPGQQRAVVGTVSRARAPRGRVAGTYTGCTLVDATDGTRAMAAWVGRNCRVAMASRFGWRGVRRLIAYP